MVQLTASTSLRSRPPKASQFALCDEPLATELLSTDAPFAKPASDQLGMTVELPGDLGNGKPAHAADPNRQPVPSRVVVVFR
jgi:hypothetical protein